MLTMLAQGLFTTTGRLVFLGTMVVFFVCRTIAEPTRAGRLPRWWDFAPGLFLLILFADLLLFSHLTDESRLGAVVSVAIFGAYLLLAKSGRSVLRSEGRHAGRATPVPHRRGRLTIYVVVTTLVVLGVGIPLSAALIKLLEHHAPDWAWALEGPIAVAVFFGLMFATLDCLWRWLEGPRARRV